MRARRTLWAPVALTIALVALALTAISQSSRWQPPRSDLVAANDIVHTVSSRWENLTLADLGTEFSQVTVQDASGSLVLARGEPILDDLQAYRQRAATFEVLGAQGERLGQVRVLDDAWEVARDRSETAAAWARGTVVAMALGVLSLTWWLNRRIIAPFRDAERFATEVAQGNLEAPLAMDRRNVLGAFTESFDLMRTELASARAREAETRQATKDLVAELSHDIRTPLASIGATAELLALTEPDPVRRSQLEVVVAKSTQIGTLAAELFQASKEELAALPLKPQEITSVELTSMLRQAEGAYPLHLEPLPDCLLEVDPRRLQQVLDNIVANADKYAETGLDCGGSLDEGFLQVRLRDRGPALPVEELESVLGKGVRGSTAAGRTGSGLGLYTSAYLMERMGGSLHLERADPGLAVVLDLPLAR